VKITILCIGKTNTAYLKEGISIYLDRLKHYARLEYRELPDVSSKGLTPDQLKQKEGELLFKTLKLEDHVLLLDERGEEFSSRKFASFIQKKLNTGAKSLVLIIGGAFGFSEEIYARANGKISLSQMTFSHEMIRLLLVEQTYRAFTILKGESYHHD
jgi:23S rRNA (pseudouridine1915-N3)-methyltransferase